MAISTYTLHTSHQMAECRKKCSYIVKNKEEKQHFSNNNINMYKSYFHTYDNFMRHIHMKILDFNTYQNIYDDEAGWGKRTGYFVVL